MTNFTSKIHQTDVFKNAAMIRRGALFLVFVGALLWSARQTLYPGTLSLVESNIVAKLKVDEIEVTNVERPFYASSHIIPDNLDFDFGTKSMNENSFGLDPLFTCKHSDKAGRGLYGRAKKLVFVHIFKTAGSTLRGLFKRYSGKCHAGWQLTIRCAGVNATSVLPTNSTENSYPAWWNFGSNEPCVPKNGLTRHGKNMKFPSHSFTNEFLERHVDIMGGHLELGSADFTWNQYKDLRYVAFFRDATAMFVSGTMYNKRRTLEQHVEEIQIRVESDLAVGKYNSRYSSYLMTPFQKAELRRQKRKLSPQEKSNLMQKNIVDYQIICGITERMPQSLEVLHYVMDSDNGARSLFEEWGMPDKHGKIVHAQKRSNTAAHSQGITTSQVIAALRKNATFAALLEEYVKYEQQVTDLAYRVHMHQYASIKRNSTVVVV